MNAVRIIPCLDVDRGRVVKGVRFRRLRDVGDPAALARSYYQLGADEIAFLDIGATPQRRPTLLKVLERVSEQVFVPLLAGGGVRGLADVGELLRAGADKVAICSAALSDPPLLARAAERYGSQCIVLSVDARRSGGSWRAYAGGGRKDSGRDVLAWVREAVTLGVGEILLNSIDRDGTQDGYDLALIRAVSETVPVPVIASGGAGGPATLWSALEAGGADAVLLASPLHEGKYSIAEIKTYLQSQGRCVRWLSHRSI